MKKTWKKGTAIAANVVILAGLAGFSFTEYQQLQDTKTVLERTEKTVKEQGAVIKGLQVQNEDLAKHNEELQKTKGELEQVKQELDNQLAGKQEELQNKDKTIQNQQSEIENLKKIKASRRASATASAPKTETQPQPKPAQPEQVKQTPKNETSVAGAMTFRATAYSDQEPLEMGGGVTTASGTRVTEGRTIAVDPKVIPLGSKVKITVPNMPQYNGVYIAEDTGGAIKGNIIDIYIRDLGAVNAFGRQTIYVEVL